jgi:hypothetical protein
MAPRIDLWSLGCRRRLFTLRNRLRNPGHPDSGSEGTWGMNCLVIYDSQFGNTEQIAQAVATRFEAIGPV